MRNPFIAGAKRPQVVIYGPGLRAMHGRNLETGDEKLIKKRLKKLKEAERHQEVPPLIRRKSDLQIREEENK